MARFNVGNGNVSFVSESYRGSNARVDRGTDMVDVSVSNGSSYMGLYLAPHDAREMARALILAADAIDADTEGSRPPAPKSMVPAAIARLRAWQGANRDIYDLRQSVILAAIRLDRGAINIVDRNFDESAEQLIALLNGQLSNPSADGEKLASEVLNARSPRVIKSGAGLDS